MTYKSLLLLAAVLPHPLAAQTAPAISAAPAPASQTRQAETAVSDTPALPAPTQVDAEVEEILVSVGRQRGAVEGDIQPEVQLGPRDIRALGAGSISDLIDALGPELRSGRGRSDGPPVVLVDGRRTSGFQEIRNLPPEAIERVDILPEEVALRYGYRADQRVINFVLRQRFRAVTVQLEPKFATDGGRPTMEAEGNILRIRNGTRISIEGQYEHQSMLRESWRDVLVDPATDRAQAARNAEQRSLLSQSDNVQIGGSWSGGLSEHVTASVNTRFEATDSRSLNGLPSAALASGAAADPLERLRQQRSARAGTAVNGPIGDWRWSLTASYDYATSDTDTDREGSGGVLRTDSARTRTGSGQADFLLNGALAELPAGRITTSLRAGVERQDQDNESQRAGVITKSALGRTRGEFTANVDLPISSRRRGVLSAIGDLSLNGNVAVESLSDFGTLTTYGYGLNWRPADFISFLASGTHEQGAPGIAQLGDPLLATPNVRVFDFVNGETVDITRLDGGNRDLLSDSRRVLKLGMNIQPIKDTDFSIRADFIDSHISNPVSGFPTNTPEIEAAFPNRFLRDASGRLLQIDNRPVNFRSQDRQELRWGISWSETLEASAREKAAMEARMAEARARAPRPAGTPGPGTQPAPGTPAAGGGPRMAGGPGGGGMRGGMRPGEGRMNLTLYHTMRFQDEISIRDGVPVLDLLNGSATGSRGGVSRHEIEARAFGAKNGIGSRLSATWKSGTTLLAEPGGAPTPEDLFFSPYMSTDLRLFVDFGQRPGVARKHPLLRGARMTLGVDNLFNARQQVQDREGNTPIGYQPNLLDPLGRTVFISVRKIFLPGFRTQQG